MKKNFKKQKGGLVIKIALGIVLAFLILGAINMVIGLGFIALATNAFKDATKQLTSIPSFNSQSNRTLNNAHQPLRSRQTPNQLRNMTEELNKALVKETTKLFIPLMPKPKTKPIIKYAENNSAIWNKITMNGQTCWFRREHGQMIKKCN